MNNPVVVWASLLLMDAWHWTSLVVLLCYAGLRAIPEAYYRAARIDGAGPWAIFRHIQLPRLRLVLLIAILLRLMDSFMIYAEAYVVTRGGPGVSTTFLSHELIQTATIQFDLGEGGAMSIIYLLIIAGDLMGVLHADRAASGAGSMKGRMSMAPLVYVVLLMTPVYWLVAMSFKTNAEIGGGLTFYPHERRAWKTMR